MEGLFVDVVFEIFNVFFKLFVQAFSITVVKAYMDLKILCIGDAFPSSG